MNIIGITRSDEAMFKVVVPYPYETRQNSKRHLFSVYMV